SFDVQKDITYDPAGPRPDQIVLLTASDGKGHNGGIQDIVPNAVQNRKEFCDVHGYINHFINISKYNMGEDTHAVWKKLPAIVETFQTYPDAQWVWWLDLDAIIMTPSKPIEEKILSHAAILKNIKRETEFVGSDRTPFHVFTEKDPDANEVDMLIAQDQNGLNAGSFMLRRSEWTAWLLEMWKDPIFRTMKDWPGREQDALIHLATQHPKIRSHMGIVSQRVLNAYPEGGSEMGWRKGDLVVHLAGCWVGDKCPQRWNKMWNQREIVPPSGTIITLQDKREGEEKLKAAEAAERVKQEQKKIVEEDEGAGYEAWKLAQGPG
ncbi:hypothetical protein NA57DRAFT_40922, partial [Rhizodiscina lignyota]